MAGHFREPAERAELERAIAAARALPQADPIRRAAALRADFDAELATAAIGQAQLREAARSKFGELAETLLFSPDGLQQASRVEVADHRATRFAAAGLGSVLDLGCGIGSDALAFVRAGLAVTGVERDPVTAEFARANLASGTRAARAARAAGAAGAAGAAAVIVVGSAEQADWRAAESVFLDPARRTGQSRTFDPARYSPSFDFVLGVLGGARHAAAKLGPGLAHALIPDALEAEWVSFAGGLKEAVLWSAGFTGETVCRRATVLPAGAQLTDADPEVTDVGAIGDYLYEPDPAVIRAGLARQLAAVLPGGRRIEEQLAYLSADSALGTPLARGFRVLDVQPYSVKRLRAELGRREVGTVEIKKRGVDVDPAQLRKLLKPRGPNSLTVLLARVQDRHLAVIAEPLGR